MRSLLLVCVALLALVAVSDAAANLAQLRSRVSSLQAQLSKLQTLSESETEAEQTALVVRPVPKSEPAPIPNIAPIPYGDLYVEAWREIRDWIKFYRVQAQQFVDASLVAEINRHVPGASDAENEWRAKFSDFARDYQLKLHHERAILYEYLGDIESTATEWYHYPELIQTEAHALGDDDPPLVHGALVQKTPQQLVDGLHHYNNIINEYTNYYDDHVATILAHSRPSESDKQRPVKHQEDGRRRIHFIFNNARLNNWDIYEKSKKAETVNTGLSW